MKIGIVGGTFDPIHQGHLMLGRYAKEQFSLDKIWFMPNGTPPHKPKDMLETDAKHRVEMVKRAIRAEQDFVLQLYEVEHPGVHYSYRTMEYFRATYPEDEFYFIVGADSLFHLEEWKHPERLLKTCILLATYRDGKNRDDMQKQIICLNKKYSADIRLLDMPSFDVASREIRRRLQLGLQAEGDIPAEVLSYIKEQHLYPFDLAQLKEAIQTCQSSKRYEHTQGVMYTAAALAMRYGENMQKALVAGLLHDCAKEYPYDKALALANEAGIVTNHNDPEPALLHAPLGAYLAKERYGIDDAEILQAITSHTTGRPDMTLLEKILYVADYIEPGRDQAPELAQIRHLAFADLELALQHVLRATLTYLKSRNKTIDPMTEQAYEFYQKERTK